MLQEDMENMGQTPALAQGEYILWRGKPKRSAYIADKALSLLPIAVLWMFVDFQLIQSAISSQNLSTIAFMMVHMLPVWLWLGNAITAVLQWKNEDYFITNKRIIIRKGIFSVNRESIFLWDVRTVQVRVGLLDSLFGSGDVLINYQRVRKHSTGWFLINLENPQQVHERIEHLALEAGSSREEERYY